MFEDFQTQFMSYNKEDVKKEKDMQDKTSRMEVAKGISNVSNIFSPCMKEKVRIVEEVEDKRVIGGDAIMSPMSLM